MGNKFLCLIICLAVFAPAVLSDAFVPEFSTMQNLRCDFEEAIYNQDGSLVTKSKQFRLYRLDDAYKKIYLQKEPIDKVLQYESGKIEFNLQSMTDDYIMMSHTIIDRTAGSYYSEAVITYDNPVFGVKHSKSNGSCRIVN